MITSQTKLIGITSLAFVATVAAVMTGGVPLAVGLGGAAAAALWLLPGGSRRYLLRRVGRVAVSIFVAMAIVWLLVHNYPDQSRQDEAGLVPAMERYVDWIAGLAAGELGESSYSETVGEGVSRTIPLSMQLVLYSQILAVAVAVPGAMIGARLRGKAADLGFRAAGLFGLSTPIFVVGPLLVFLFAVGSLSIFGVEVGVSLFSAGRYRPIGDGVWPHISSMALPSITMAITTAAVYMVILRAEMLQQLRSDHVLLARSKGVSDRQIVRLHALRPAAPTMVASIAAQSGLILGNLIITERIFLLPGFGDYVVVAIGRRDVLAVTGAIFVAAIILGVVNLFADALLLAVDPRLDQSASTR